MCRSHSAPSFLIRCLVIEDENDFQFHVHCFSHRTRPRPRFLNKMERSDTITLGTLAHFRHFRHF